MTYIDKLKLFVWHEVKIEYTAYILKQKADSTISS